MSQTIVTKSTVKPGKWRCNSEESLYLELIHEGLRIREQWLYMEKLKNYRHLSVKMKCWLCWTKCLILNRQMKTRCFRAL